MGLSSTASQNRPDAGRRSIRSAFVVTVVAPAAVLVVLWLACAGLVAGSAMTGHGYLAQHKGLIGISAAAVGTLVIIAIVALTASFARRLARDVAGLAVTAQRLTAQPAGQVPVRERGGAPAALSPVPDAPRRATAEVASAGAAMIGLQSAAAAAASSEASLRNGLREVFVSMARRNQSLLQRQLRLIDALEQKASDPAALADLFSLDHLTTRMRRHAESLAILSGAAPGRAWREPVPVIDVIRGAMAEVEDYKRVSVLTRSEDSVAGAAVADMIHLLAELIENATLFSPSGTRVEVRAGRVANGFAVEIDDRGLGVEPEQLAEINRQLASPPDFDLANADRLGLFVGGKLAARHGVRVSLRTSPYGGTTAIVLMPSGIVVPPPGALLDGFPADGPEAELASRPAGLDLHGSESLGVTGRHQAPAADDRLAPTFSNGSLSGPPAAVARPATCSPADPRIARRPCLASRLRCPPAVPRPGRPPARPARPRPRRPLFRSPGFPIPAGAEPPRRPPARRPPAAARRTTARWTARCAAPPRPAAPPRAPRRRPALPGPGSPAADPGPAAPDPARPGSSGSDVFRRTSRAEAGGDQAQAGDEGRYHGLPRRTRQANLSPHLRESTLAPGRHADAGSGLPPEDIPAPEHARNLASSLQSGWRRGRASDDPAGTPGPAGEAEPGSPGPTDSPPATSMPGGERQDSEEPLSEDG